MLHLVAWCGGDLTATASRLTLAAAASCRLYPAGTPTCWCSAHHTRWACCVSCGLVCFAYRSFSAHGPLHPCAEPRAAAATRCPRCCSLLPHFCALSHLALPSLSPQFIHRMVKALAGHIHKDAIAVSLTKVGLLDGGSRPVPSGLNTLDN